VIEAKNAFLRVLGRRGYKVTVVQDGPTFCRMVVERSAEEVLVDLAIDSPPRNAPTVTVLGPTLAPLELAGRKLLALFGRAEARDFADVYVLAQRFGKDALLEQAEALDAGFDLQVLAQMMGTLGRFADDEIPLAASDVPLVEYGASVGVQVAGRDGRILVSGDPCRRCRSMPASAIQVSAVWRRPCRTRPGEPISCTTASLWVASRRVAAVITPPRGPVTSGSSSPRPTVRRASVGLKGSMIGKVRPPALGRLGHQTAAAGVGLPGHVE
jgi:hypothetical protein